MPERLRISVPGQGDVAAHDGELILDGPTYRTVHLPARVVGPALPGYTQGLFNSAPRDPTATSYVRLGPRNEIDVVGIDGRLQCRCGIAKGTSTGFYPLPSHRAGVLVTQLPYLAIQRVSVESYATHSLRSLPYKASACAIAGVHSTPDSAYLAVDDECGRTTMYDLRTGTVTALFTVPSASINDASGLAGDRFAFGDSHGNTYVYDVHGRELFALVDGAGAVEGIDASDDGRTIATASSDGTLRIWSGTTGSLMRRIDTGGNLDSVAVAPDGSAVYTDTQEGLIEGFDTCPLCNDGPALLAASDPLAVRTLSPAERRAFGASA
jgi:hypothetical protein